MNPEVCVIVLNMNEKGFLFEVTKTFMNTMNEKEAPTSSVRVNFVVQRRLSEDEV